MNNEQQAWIDGIWEKLQRKLLAECQRTGTDIPFIPLQGHYKDCMMPGGLCWWTNGFWPGILWQMYHATGEDTYRLAAAGVGKRMTAILDEPQKLDHDIGFLVLPGAVTEYRLTGNADCRLFGIRAADFLADRFNKQGNFIRAWDKSPWAEDVSGWMIVDCMLNIPLLYWASHETGDTHYVDIANRHAETALRCLLRPDGSCNHIATFNSTTGEFLGSIGGQGYGNGSSWSRGQGWAVYGFALAYRNTGNPAFLDAAKRSAHYCIAALTANDWLPLVDFRAPANPIIYDSGAGAIIACGLLETAEHVPALEQKLYRTAALHILQACEAKFADWNPDNDGILFGGGTMYHNDRLAGQAYIYNDYFLLEAILRLMGKHFMVWGNER